MLFYTQTVIVTLTGFHTHADSEKQFITVPIKSIYVLLFYNTEAQRISLCVFDTEVFTPLWWLHTRQKALRRAVPQLRQLTGVSHVTFSSRKQSKTIHPCTKQAKVHFKNEQSAVDEFEVLFGV